MATRAYDKSHLYFSKYWDTVFIYPFVFLSLSIWFKRHITGLKLLIAMESYICKQIWEGTFNNAAMLTSTCGMDGKCETDTIFWSKNVKRMKCITFCVVQYKFSNVPPKCPSSSITLYGVTTKNLHQQGVTCQGHIPWSCFWRLRQAERMHMWQNPGCYVLQVATVQSTGNTVKHMAESHLDPLKLVWSHFIWVSDAKVRGQPGRSVVQLDPEVVITKNTLSETDNRRYIYSSQNLIVNGKTTLWYNCLPDHLYT